MALVKKYQIVMLNPVIIQSDTNQLTFSEITSYQNPFNTLQLAENALRTIHYPGTFTILKIYIQS